MNGTAVQVWINDRPLADVGYAGDLGWSHRWPGCSWTARWRMSALARSTHQLLHRGARVELRHGPFRVWGPGVLADPDYDTGIFTCNGPARVLEKLQAIDGSGDPTDDPEVALEAAIARGVLVLDGWDNLPAPFPASTARSIKQLLDDCTLAESKRWGIDINNRLITRTTEATPTPRWAITPDVARPGLADDDYATAIQLRYVSELGGVPAVPSQYATAIATAPIAAARFGPVEVPVDATSLGLLTETQAENRAQGILNTGRARLSFTAGYDLAPVQLTTIGGAPAFLPYVMADGSAARHHGVFDDRGAAVLDLAADFVIGETVHTNDATTLRITPVDTAARSFGANLEKIGSR